MKITKLFTYIELNDNASDFNDRGVQSTKAMVNDSKKFLKSIP